MQMNRQRLLRSASGRVRRGRRATGRVVVSALGFAVAYYFDTENGGLRRKRLHETLHRVVADIDSARTSGDRGSRRCSVRCDTPSAARVVPAAARSTSSGALTAPIRGIFPVQGPSFLATPPLAPRWPDPSNGGRAGNVSPMWPNDRGVTGAVRRAGRSPVARA